MIPASEPANPTLAAAERVVTLLELAGVESVVIGAAALAAHRYARSTEDLDLAVGVDPSQLHGIARDLAREGFDVDVSEPDREDPLGGVLRVTQEGIDRIEIVNFVNPPSGGFPALIELALKAAAPYRVGAVLRVVTLPHLVIFKLYAGGPKSKSDVLELLSRNPEVELEGLRELCRHFRMDRTLDAWLRELREP